MCIQKNTKLRSPTMINVYCDVVGYNENIHDFDIMFNFETILSSLPSELTI